VLPANGEDYNTKEDHSNDKAGGTEQSDTKEGQNETQDHQHNGENELQVTINDNVHLCSCIDTHTKKKKRV
jgi:hypothetical protein